jgi:hypothetical protein
MIYSRDARNMSQIKQKANMEGIFKLAAVAAMAGTPSAAVHPCEQSMVASKMMNPIAST